VDRLQADCSHALLSSISLPSQTRAMQRLLPRMYPVTGSENGSEILLPKFPPVRIYCLRLFFPVLLSYPQSHIFRFTIQTPLRIFLHRECQPTVALFPSIPLLLRFPLVRRMTSRARRPAKLPEASDLPQIVGVPETQSEIYQ